LFGDFCKAVEFMVQYSSETPGYAAPAKKLAGAYEILIFSVKPGWKATAVCHSAGFSCPQSVYILYRSLYGGQSTI